MIRLAAIAATTPGLRVTEVAAWVERGWVSADLAGDDPAFAEVTAARIRLIHDLRALMQIDDETIPLILSLLDQVHETRGWLRGLMRAIEAQPEPVRRAILDALR